MMAAESTNVEIEENRPDADFQGLDSLFICEMYVEKKYIFDDVQQQLLCSNQVSCLN